MLRQRLGSGQLNFVHTKTTLCTALMALVGFIALPYADVVTNCTKDKSSRRRDSKKIETKFFYFKYQNLYSKPSFFGKTILHYPTPFFKRALIFTGQYAI
jgi:hypothetical protein